MLPSGFGSDGVWTPVCVNPYLRLSRYSAGQRFERHRDVRFCRPDRCSILSVVIYLSRDDEYAGGHTLFYAAGPAASVRPGAGSALLFLHSREHAGAEVTAGSKLIRRADVMFQRRCFDLGSLHRERQLLSRDPLYCRVRYYFRESVLASLLREPERATALFLRAVEEEAKHRPAAMLVSLGAFALDWAATFSDAASVCRLAETCRALREWARAGGSWSRLHRARRPAAFRGELSVLPRQPRAVPDEYHAAAVVRAERAAGRRRVRRLVADVGTTNVRVWALPGDAPEEVKPPLIVPLVLWAPAEIDDPWTASIEYCLATRRRSRADVDFELQYVPWWDARLWESLLAHHVADELIVTSTVYPSADPFRAFSWVFTGAFRCVHPTLLMATGAGCSGGAEPLAVIHVGHFVDNAIVDVIHDHRVVWSMRRPEHPLDVTGDEVDREFRLTELQASTGGADGQHHLLVGGEEAAAAAAASRANDDRATAGQAAEAIAQRLVGWIQTQLREAFPQLRRVLLHGKNCPSQQDMQARMPEMTFLVSPHGADTLLRGAALTFPLSEDLW